MGHEATGVTPELASGRAAIAVPAPAPARKRNRVGTVQAELGDKTRRLYAGAWARFVQFCGEHGASALPASPDAVAAFMRQPVRGRGGVARILAAIDHMHRQRGLATRTGCQPARRITLGPQSCTTYSQKLRRRRRRSCTGWRDPVPAT